MVGWEVIASFIWFHTKRAPNFAPFETSTSKDIAQRSYRRLTVDNRLIHKNPDLSQ